MATASLVPPARGLAEEEAARRLAERGPPRKASSSRSYGSIVRANVFTIKWRGVERSHSN